MKVLCNREKLREGLAVANGVIPAKSTKPVLENVCLVATDKGLELLGTDLEISLRYTISDVEVSEPGTAVIPARVTLDFIRDLSSETVTMEVELVALENKRQWFVFEMELDEKTDFLLFGRCPLSLKPPPRFGSCLWFLRWNTIRKPDRIESS